MIKLGIRVFRKF